MSTKKLINDKHLAHSKHLVDDGENGDPFPK